MTPTAAAPRARRARLEPLPDPGRAPAPEPCAGCGAPVAADYCGECGERRRTPDALSLRHLAADAFEHATSLDVRLLHTLVTLVRRPGEPTRAWVAGARRRYTPPLQLLLLLNVVFFLAAPRLGLLRYGIDPQAASYAVSRAKEPARGGSVAERAFVAAARRTGGTAAEFRERFNAAVEDHTRSLISFFVVALAATVALTYLGSGRYLAEHLVFATHAFTFVLLWVPAVLLPQRALMRALQAHGARHALWWAAYGAVGVVLVGIYAYLAAALRRVYGGRWPAALLRAAVVLGLQLRYAAAIYYQLVMLTTSLLL